MVPSPGAIVVSLPEQIWIARLGDIAGVEFVVNDLVGPITRAAEIEVLVPPYATTRFDVERLAELPRLRHVQLLTAGYDNVAGRLPAGVTLANAQGLHDSSTAELALTLALAALREVPDWVRDQDAEIWPAPRFRAALADRRALIVGYGGIGRAIARRLLPFEVTVTAVASTARDGDDIVPHVHGVAELGQLLPAQDVVFLAVPLTEQTHAMVDDAFLQALPDDALVVNIARGGIVDTAALLRQAGRLRFALDVTDPEPLPPGHPLWSAPRVLISPHTGGPTTAFVPRATAVLHRQLAAYLAGRPLPGLVT